MKQIGFWIILFGLIFGSCNSNTQIDSNSVNRTKKSSTFVETENTVEIQNLMRSVLKWANSKNSIDLLPVNTDKKDSIYIGFDMKRLNQNLISLEMTNLFSKEFIENYHQIILKLDRDLKSIEFKDNPWFVGDIPPFNFASDVDPWCLCQDVPYDTPNPWELIIVEHLNRNFYTWKWRNVNMETESSLEEFSYKFKVKRENSKLKVSFLEGFEI